MKIIDLSLPLAHHMPRYPSQYLPDVQVIPAATHEKHGRSAHTVTFGTHVSTHVDAPYHALPKGKKIDELLLEHFIGRARIVRIGGSRDKQSPISAKDLSAAGDLSAHAKLILDTGWAKRVWGTPEYFTEGPYLTRDASEYLAKLPKLHLLGMDFPNIDSRCDMVPGKAAPNHQIVLGRDIILLENLLHLEEVADDFFLSAAPLKLTGGDGCPCRAAALFPLKEVAEWIAPR